MPLKVITLDPVLEILIDTINEKIPWGKAEFVMYDNKILTPLINEDGYQAILRVPDYITNNVHYKKITLSSSILQLSAEEIVNAISKEIDFAIDELNDEYVKVLVQNDM